MGITQVLLGCCVLSAVVVAYPSGAPDTPAILQSMRPGHKGQPQPASSCPYEIFTNKTGSTVEIKLSSRSKSKISYRGFLIEVRNVNGTRIGAFKASSKYKVIGRGSAVTHRSADSKASLVFKWKMPRNVSNATVYYTVVQKYSKYWVALTKRII